MRWEEIEQVLAGMVHPLICREGSRMPINWSTSRLMPWSIVLPACSVEAMVCSGFDERWRRSGDAGRDLPSGRVEGISDLILVLMSLHFVKLSTQRPGEPSAC